MQNKSKRQLKKEQEIKKENILKFEEEVEKNRKIPEELKTKIKKSVFRNSSVAFFIVVYLIFLNITFNIFETELYIKVIKICSLIIGAISICLFEIGYRKDNEYIFLNGAEIFITGIISLCTLYVYFLFFNLYNKVLITIIICIIAYFLIKIIILIFKIQKEYFKEKNDIKNII